MRPTFRAVLLSLLIGVLASIVIAVLAGLRLLPEGSAASTMVIELSDDTGFGPGWMVRVDERWFGCVSRGRAFVAPSTYGIGADGTVLLSLDKGESRLDEGGVAAGPRMPFIMPTGGDVDDIPLAVASVIESGGSGSDTLLAWPFERRVGWPAPCMRYWIASAGGWNRGTFWSRTPFAIEGGWHAGLMPGRSALDVRVIPFEILWSGLALDAVVFGAMALVVGQGLLALRAHRRRRAGLCIVCGYRVDDAATCSECGSVVAVQKQRRPPPG